MAFCQPCHPLVTPDNKVDPAVLRGERAPTKREVLRTLMSIYNPLGLIAHFLIYVEILLQAIWRMQIDWDDTISNKREMALLGKPTTPY